jgi:hypothetical protein
MSRIRRLQLAFGNGWVRRPPERDRHDPVRYEQQPDERLPHDLSPSFTHRASGTHRAPLMLGDGRVLQQGSLARFSEALRTRIEMAEGRPCTGVL